MYIGFVGPKNIVDEIERVLTEFLESPQIRVQSFYDLPTCFRLLASALDPLIKQCTSIKYICTTTGGDSIDSSNPKTTDELLEHCRKASIAHHLQVPFSYFLKTK